MESHEQWDYISHNRKTETAYYKVKQIEINKRPRLQKLQKKSENWLKSNSRDTK
jgi:hypothetical protein